MPLNIGIIIIYCPRTNHDDPDATVDELRSKAKPTRAWPVLLIRVHLLADPLFSSPADFSPAFPISPPAPSSVLVQPLDSFRGNDIVGSCGLSPHSNTLFCVFPFLPLAQHLSATSIQIN